MKKAFTLVELLIVIGIISIISIVIVASFSGAQKKARDTKSKADLTAIASALEAYKSQKGLYPDSTADGCDQQQLSLGKFVQLDADSVCVSLSSLVSLGYISSFPKDTNTTKGYFYTTKFSNADKGKNFKIIKIDPELMSSGDTNCHEVAGDYYDAKRPCNAYQVTSNSSVTSSW